MKNSVRILVVDDETDITDIVTEVLIADGYHVDVAHSGEEALELFAKSKYSVVISDIVMSGMSGIDLLTRIKRVNADAQVIMMSSHAALNTAISALRSGAYDYLVKPFDDINTISLVAQRAVEKVGLLKENRSLVEGLIRKNEESARINDVLRVLAVEDGLTGLYNHRHFHELLAVEVERSKRYKHGFSMLFIDVDHFKLYNDMNGHLAGDKAFHELAELVKKHTRKSCVAARYGGEEFAIILPETTREEAFIFAENLRALVADHPFPGREKQPGGKFTVSIGVASYPHHGADTRSLIAHAEKALHAAKNTGKNRVC